eukprot:maker-scaffold_1-snap-gene-31.39-mRNA-1 protein AED:0.10 eAED:0.10 QI:0/0/0/1/1/1/2/0/862
MKPNIITETSRRSQYRLNKKFAQELTFTPLGSGKEVGRSCHLIEINDKKILLDCGLHPGKRGFSSLPFFDTINPASIDLILISHFHVDHVAALPYFTEKTNFKGQIYMTRATRVVTELLLKDYVRVTKNRNTSSSASADYQQLYNEKDVENCLRKCSIVDFHQQLEVEGIKFTPLFAGHVLGAAMFLINIGPLKILYTGDYSGETDRHLNAAEVPDNLIVTEEENGGMKSKIDLLIMESTFGTIMHQPREQREAMFVKQVEEVLFRGGVCLIPVFSLGRAQELLLILEAYWKANESLQQFKIYHYSKLAEKALEVYQTYLNVMNDKIIQQSKVSNPWKFDFILPLDEKKESLNSILSGPCVIMASPGMLQSGVSRRIFERIAPEQRNGLVLSGYSIEGTLAYTLAKESNVKSFESFTSGRKIPINCSIEQVSFAAHTDVKGSEGLVGKLRAEETVLVHGDANQMRRLRRHLLTFHQDKVKEKIKGLEDSLKQVLISKQELEKVEKKSTAQQEELKQFEVKEESIKDIISLRQKDLTKYRIYMPFNTQSKKFVFRQQRLLRVTGQLSQRKRKQAIVNFSAEQDAIHGLKLNGYLLRKSFEERLIHKDDLPIYTDITSIEVDNVMNVAFRGSLEELKFEIRKLFEIFDKAASAKREEKGKSSAVSFVVGSRKGVQLVLDESNNAGVTLTWKPSFENDLIAEALAALLPASDTSMKKIKQSRCLCSTHVHNPSVTEVVNTTTTTHILEKFKLVNEGFSLLWKLLVNEFGEENLRFDPKLILGGQPVDDIALNNVDSCLCVLDPVLPSATPVERTVLCKMFFDENGHLLNLAPGTETKTPVKEILNRIVSFVDTVSLLTCPLDFDS